MYLQLPFCCKLLSFLKLFRRKPGSAKEACALGVLCSPWPLAPHENVLAKTGSGTHYAEIVIKTLNQTGDQVPHVPLLAHCVTDITALGIPLAVISVTARFLKQLERFVKILVVSVGAEATDTASCGI